MTVKGILLSKTEVCLSRSFIELSLSRDHTVANRLGIQPTLYLTAKAKYTK